MITLLHGDCLELMTSIPDGSIDLVLADLPYGTTACKWDTIIPLEPLWKEYKRVIKRNGAIVLTASQPFTSALVMSNPTMFRFAWVWDKVNRNTNYGNVRFMPLRRHEDVLVFSIGTPTYNAQMTVGTPYSAKRSGVRPGVYENGGLYPRDGVNLGIRYPVSVLAIEADRKNEMGLHPTQKPVALMEYLIRTYTDEIRTEYGCDSDVTRATVLDNTMGSGTTGVACVNTNRHFIGIEQDAGYFEIAQRRIEEAQNKARQLTLLEVAS